MAKNKGSDDFQDRILDMISKSFEDADIDKNGSLSRQVLGVHCNYSTISMFSHFSTDIMSGKTTSLDLSFDLNSMVCTLQELALKLGTNKGLMSSAEKLEEFHGMDSNGDNSLSWREFMLGSFSKDFVDSFDRGHVDIEGLNVEGGRAEYEAFHAYHKFGR